LKKVVILWSGGLDSTCLVLWALKNNNMVFPLFLNRHQSNYKWEKKAIEDLFNSIKENYSNLKLQKYREFEIISPPKQLKKEFIDKKQKFVYFLRNSDLLINAIRLALCKGIENIFLGNVVDDLKNSEIFPDIHPEYLKMKNNEINKALQIMHENPINIYAPFIEMNWKKKDAIKFVKNNFSKIDLQITRSCYSKKSTPCKKCKACRIRENLEI